MFRRDFASLSSANVVIVGGGVIGLSIARALAIRGAEDIVLVEKGPVLGGEASHAAGGILAPQVETDKTDDFFRLACASRDMYPSFAAALNEETGIDVELDTTGTIYVALNDEDAAELARRFEWQMREGLRVEWLTGEQVRSIEANLSANVRCALRFPQDYQVDNRKLISALIHANQKLGVKLITDCNVGSLRIENGAITGVDSSQMEISASQVVVTAGAWTSELNFAGADYTAVEIEPVRGQMLCFKPPEAIASHVIYSSRGYLIPRRDGRLLAGSTSEQAGFEKRVTIEGIASIRLMACDIIPSIAELPLNDSWAGLRPHAPDGLPILGPVARVKGLFYATGHYRNGILLAPITAELMADAICDGRMPPLLESFSVERFSLRNA